MTEQEHRTMAALAILTLAEIKGAAESFDSGRCGIFDCLDSILEAMAAYQASVLHRPRREAA
jgi:hypothetical protein